MAHPLIGLHAILGELGAISFLWIFIELLHKDLNLKRMRIVAILGTVLIALSWFLGGYYYVNFYGSDVKPKIKQGPWSWAHGVFMETKEHIFLFLPFLSLLMVVSTYNKEFAKYKKSFSYISLSIFILGFIVAIMGAIVSMGFRVALGG